jgi:hypothetical protein
MQSPQSFLGSLFDFSFTSFITSKLIKVLYGLLMAIAALYAIFFIIIGFSQGTGLGLFMLIIVAPIVFFLSVIYARVLLELIIVVFRIAEHTSEIAEQGRNSPSRMGN